MSEIVQKAKNNSRALKFGRNSQCYCGSGKKYKLCCLLQEEKTPVACSASVNLPFGRADFNQAETVFHDADAYNNHGVQLQGGGDIEGAIDYFRKACAMKPGFAEAECNLGAAMLLLGSRQEAIEHLHRAISFNPDIAEAHSNLGFIYMQDCNEDAAITRYQAALRINPDYVHAHTNLMLLMEASTKFTPEEIFEEHRRFFQPIEAAMMQSWQPHQNVPSPDKKLKIGYVSSDFYSHAASYFMIPVFEHHDRSKFELHGYNSSHFRDRTTDRIATCFDGWHDCRPWSDDVLANRIRDDSIDILVDLSSITAYSRLAAFSKKPSPVQVTWMGFPSTTGLQAIDYRLTDEYMDPPGMTERYHTETLVRLSVESAYQPPSNCPEVNMLPALSSGQFVLACMNNPAKINPPVIRLWGRILKALPQAKLMLSAWSNIATMQRLQTLFAAEQIDLDRLIFQPWMSITDFLALHHHIDLALDCFPYNGGTTTSHSLWMGVPVVTLTGSRPVSRCGASILMRANLPEFVTDSEDEYIDRVIQFANNLPLLNVLRQSLRASILSKKSNSPDHYVRELEAAYRSMWQAWCNKQIP